MIAAASGPTLQYWKTVMMIRTGSIDEKSRKRARASLPRAMYEPRTSAKPQDKTSAFSVQNATTVTAASANNFSRADKPCSQVLRAR